MKFVYAAFTGLTLLVLATISVQNPTLITIRFLGWQTGVLPLWVIIVAAFGMGMLLVALVTLPGRISRFRTTRQLQHQRVVAGSGAYSSPASVNPIAGAPAHADRLEHTPSVGRSLDDIRA